MRRAALGLALVLAGCPRAGSETAPDPPPTETVNVSIAGLFGGAAPRSRYVSLDDPGWTRRILLPQSALDPHAEGAPFEPWTLEMFESSVRGLGGRLHGDAGLDPARAPTAELRPVHFVSGTDRFPLLVRAGEDGLVLLLRSEPEEESACPKELDVELGFVFLRATVLERATGEIGAVLDHFTLVEGPEVTAFSVELPISEGLRCAALQSLLNELEVNDAQFVEAARRTLDSVLPPLFPVLGTD